MAIRGADKRLSSGVWQKYYTEGGINLVSYSATVWQNMKARCREGSAYRQGRFSYDDCSMSQDFKDFQLFTNWHVNQVGYGLVGYQLDKDALFGGNKIYSSENCVLIPSQLNTFFVGKDEGKSLSQGVSVRNDSGKYEAQIRINGLNKKLGSFTTEQEAYQAYKEVKESLAHRWYKRLKAGEFVVDERVIERMRTWTLDTK